MFNDTNELIALHVENRGQLGFAVYLIDPKIAQNIPIVPIINEDRLLFACKGAAYPIVVASPRKIYASVSYSYIGSYQSYPVLGASFLKTDDGYKFLMWVQTEKGIEPVSKDKESIEYVKTQGKSIQSAIEKAKAGKAVVR